MTFSVLVALMGFLITFLRRGELDLLSLMVAHGTKLMIRDVYPPASELKDLRSFRSMFTKFVQQAACSNDPMLCKIEIPFVDAANASSIKVNQFARFDNPRFSRIFDSQIVTDTHNHSIDIRVYEPVRGENEKVGISLWLHGGGFVIGTHADDFKCTLIANSTKTVVISINYALAPEKPYPHGRIDCEHALNWMASFAAEPSALSVLGQINVDLSDVYIFGESAGGHHAAACIMNYQGSFKSNIKGLVLIYPEIEHTEELTESESSLYNFNGFFTKTQDSWFWRLYLGHEKDDQELYEMARNDPLINLVNVDQEMVTSMRHVKVLCILAKHDILYSEGIAFADMLRLKGGNDMNVQTKSYEAIHGFWGEFTFSSTRHAVDEIRKFISVS